MKLITAISSVLSIVERWLVVSLLGVLVTLAFFQVILRNFFDTGLLWADPLLRHLVLWVGFLGASIATQLDKHINIDLVTRFVTPVIAIRIRVVTNLFAALVCAFLAYAGWKFLLSELSSNEAWWLELIIPLGFGLIAARFFMRAIENFLNMLHPQSPPNE